LVDTWASVEQSELNWVRHNQKTIRAELYDGLRDNLADVNGVDMAQMGKHIILPATHPGSSRHMYQLFQDSMAITRHCGKPDIFLTMTANPSWPEIKDNVFSYDDDNDHPDRPKHQTASDRPDIVARVFAQKIKAMLKNIKDGLFRLQRCPWLCLHHRVSAAWPAAHPSPYIFEAAVQDT
jgi:Helitron helicase-like domain at N-terminus